MEPAPHHFRHEEALLRPVHEQVGRVVAVGYFDAETAVYGNQYFLTGAVGVRAPFLPLGYVINPERAHDAERKAGRIFKKAQRAPLVCRRRKGVEAAAPGKGRKEVLFLLHVFGFVYKGMFFLLHKPHLLPDK